MVHQTFPLINAWAKQMFFHVCLPPTIYAAYSNPHRDPSLIARGTWNNEARRNSWLFPLHTNDSIYSAAVTWTLYFLCRHPRVQKKLREELLAVSTDTPTVEEMNALPYLDWIIRETLRVNPPVPSLARVAGKDDVIPLRQPFKDTRGTSHDSIPWALLLACDHGRWIYCNRIKKDELIIIPIMAMNRDKSLWGDDAAEFRCVRFFLSALQLFECDCPVRNVGKRSLRLSTPFPVYGVTCCPFSEDRDRALVIGSVSLSACITSNLSK